MTLGDVIKEFRELNSISMEEFSRMSGLSKSYISMLENNKDPRGKAIKPSLETIDKVATTLHIDFDELIEMVDQDVVVNQKSEEQPLRFKYLGKPGTSEFQFLIEDEETQWKFIRYCYEHASIDDKEKVCAILNVYDKWQEYKEMSKLFNNRI